MVVGDSDPDSVRSCRHKVFLDLCGGFFINFATELHNRYIAEDLVMRKELSEMTLEELWDLFPISLVQHDEQWNECFKEIESTIKDLLAGYPVKRISHIGSTAIHDIWAKNIVDVMVEISENADMEEVSHVMEQNGFIRMSHCCPLKNQNSSLKLL